MTIHDELAQLRKWIEESGQQADYYAKMSYYWQRYEFLCFRFGVGVGVIVTGGLAILGIVFF